MRSRNIISWSLLGILFLPLAALALQPSQLKCEYRTDPAGIDTLRPRLTWGFEPTRHGVRAERQTAWQVLVASSLKQLRGGAGDLWDSGRVEGSNSILVDYKGKPLTSGQTCFWKVRVWDQDGRESDWSRPATWSMGLLKASDWKARWIGRDEVEQTTLMTNGFWIWFPEASPAKSAALGTAWFRRSFQLPEGRVVTSAKLYLTADNRFEAYLNGKKVGGGADFRTVSVFEVAGLLSASNNRLAISVENGGSAPNPAGLLGMLRVEFEAGDPLVIVTDPQWRATLEHFDGWEQPGFDDSTWLPAAQLGPVGMQPWGEIAMPEERRLPARYLRKEFAVQKRVSRAVVSYSGLGLSELYVNGKQVGDEVLSPGLTEYDKRIFYLTKDVSDFIRRGPNAIGVILGNGRFYAPRTRSPTGTRTYGFPKLILQLRVDYTDGTSDLVVSDESWDLCTEGPIHANNEYDGEEYDARLEVDGWSKPGPTPQGWTRAQVVSPPGGELVAQMIEPIRVVQTLKPVSMNEPSPGVYIFDMGQNMVGWCELRVSGLRGTVVKLRHAETLKPDGTLYMDNLRGAKVTDTYILKGKGREEYEPRFTYHGFRFVEVTGFPGKPSLTSISGRVVHDDLERTGSFACSDPLVNQIFSNIVWGVRGNYRSIPTDCPQRDERQGWLGDRSEECRGESYIFNTAPLYSKWLKDMADAQKDNGSVPDVCPSYWPFYNDNVTWPSSIAIIPGTLRDQFGDIRPVEEGYPAAKKWVQHMATFVTNGIISRDNYGDWCVPPEDPKLIHSKDPARKTDPVLLATGYLYYDTSLMRKYAELLGKTEDATYFEKLSGELKEGVNKSLLHRESGLYGNGSQTSCVLPLAFGFAPEDARPKLLAQLVEKIGGESDDHIGTGLIGGQWLMRTLTRNGRPDLAWTIASQDTYPSWGYMVKKGATTIWELWNGDTADPAMNSGNHVMLVGDLLTWMFEDLGGIRPDPAQPGFSHILMRPEIPQGLDWVRCSHKSPYGTVESEWKIYRGRFSWFVRVPANTTARVEVPADSPNSVREGGRPLQNVKGITPVAFENGRQVIEIPSGAYRFESEL